MIRLSKDVWSYLALIVVGLFYLPLDLLTGQSVLYGTDYYVLHAGRIDYAKLYLSQGILPGWNTREILGAPFWSNLQSFPWNPLRLVSFLFPTAIAFGPEIELIAFCAALFTWLYLRTIGLNRISALGGAATFALAGFFSSRTMAGQLSLLESYPALPLLLWLYERHRKFLKTSDLAYLAIVVSWTVLSGHPQLPFYAILTLVCYAIVRGQLRGLSVVVRSILIGLLLAGFALFPFALLILRSQRMLSLAPAHNDVALTFARLVTFILPWRNGAPAGVGPIGVPDFSGYPNLAYFWDGVGYVGILPLVAAVVIVLNVRNLPSQPRFFLGLLVISLVLACDWPSFRGSPGVTIFRSPARLLYLSTFGLSVLFALGLDRLYKLELGWIGKTIASGLVVLQLFDLGTFSGHFVKPIPRPQNVIEHFAALADPTTANFRVVTDLGLGFLEAPRRYDDLGFYDSIVLASTYKSFLALAGFPVDKNIQFFSAHRLPKELLAKLAVKYVVTPSTRDDLLFRENIKGVKLYELTSDPRVYFTGGDGQSSPIEAFNRTAPDQISLALNLAQSGNIHFVESFDSGWQATVNATIVTPVDQHPGFSIPVNSGQNSIKLNYHTPGKELGLLLSLLGVTALVLLVGGKFDRSPKIT